LLHSAPAGRAWLARAGRTELEFIVYNEPMRTPSAPATRPDPGHLYNLDYSILGTSRIEPLLNAITSG